MTSTDVVIAGGGVIGLSIAYALAREGLTPTVLDRGPLGRAASWAGAGILAPTSTRPPTDPWGALRARSSELYPLWSAALLSETGIDNGYRVCGGIDIARTPAEDNTLRAAAGRWRREGITFERLAPPDIRRVEPALAPDLNLADAYFLPDRAQVRNPRHVRALIQAIEGHRGNLRPGVAATGFRVVNGRVQAVETSEGCIACDAAVVAAGPWSETLLATAGVPLPTPPIKGQLVLLESPRPLLKRIVEYGKSYLVPRDDGRILLGATEEAAGFDDQPRDSDAQALLTEALTLCPILAEAEVVRTWAGLRPGSADGRPYLGPAPNLPNLFIATGHRRAGLQLSPSTAELLADLILGRPPRFDWQPFRPDRPPLPSADDPAFRS